MIETDYTLLYDYAKSHDYFLKNKNGLPYNYSYEGASWATQQLRLYPICPCCRSFYVSQVDFTNAKAVQWYQDQLARAVNISFHGWMYDYGEYTPYDSVASDGTIGIHLVYSLISA